MTNHEHKNVEARLAEIEAQIQVIAPDPWRVAFDEETGDLVIWFHADLARSPRRIVVSYEDDPSPNELAAAAFLVNSRENMAALLAVVNALLERNRWQDWCTLCGTSVSLGHKPECPLAALGGQGQEVEK